MIFVLFDLDFRFVCLFFVVLSFFPAERIALWGLPSECAAVHSSLSETLNPKFQAELAAKSTDHCTVSSRCSKYVQVCSASELLKVIRV